jgi:hypothetical protein
LAENGGVFMGTMPDAIGATALPEASKGAPDEDGVLDPVALSSPRPTPHPAFSRDELSGLSAALPSRGGGALDGLAELAGASVVEIHWGCADPGLPPPAILPPKKKAIPVRRVALTFRPFASMGATEVTVRDLRAALGGGRDARPRG